MPGPSRIRPTEHPTAALCSPLAAALLVGSYEANCGARPSPRLLAAQAVQAAKPDHKRPRHDRLRAQAGRLLEHLARRIIARAAEHGHEHRSVGDEEVRMARGQHHAAAWAEAVGREVVVDRLWHRQRVQLERVAA